ncbi:alpha/beta hydrolase family esterase [Nocardia sp. NPDC050630]|uniref:extracellular catalytic domain type 1 short-chain-length polyhydroxyalkanoate depolymerase n=1 Tax=Nocardia sp. NPDC050630 TaxID=3364321 RepID=UPI00379BBDBF
MARNAERAWLCALFALAGLVALVSAAPVSSADPVHTAGGPGRVDHRIYRSQAGGNDYLVYVPRDWKPSERLPVYVMVHGCGTTAEQMMGASLLNQLADRQRFLVAYPDNGEQCWKAVVGLPADITRGGGGDADIVAGITREVISDYHADTDRVYLAGMSSGAFQTSAGGAAYPDLYAAIGLDAGGGYGTDFITCGHSPDAFAPVNAPRAVAQMGDRARVMPVFTIGGTDDDLGEAPQVGGCARLAYIEWLATNNLLKPAPNGDTFRDDPASTTNGQIPDGHSWTTMVARGSDGCQIAERWVVDRMGHYWSGGSADPEFARFTDPKGPSAAEASWRFFRNFTLSGGNTACQPN